MSNPGVWKTWEGRVVDGKFPLRQWLGGSDHSAVFLTERPGQPSPKLAIKLVAAEATEADRQISRWRAASQLSHPNLIRILDAGRCRLDNMALLYVVMESAEEDLSQILPQRPLVPGEATDMLPPVLDALSYLHGKGLVHGRIKPSNVLAVGSRLKLSSDQVFPAAEVNSSRRRRDAYDAPETAAGIVSPASDVWSVGVTLVAALTQNTSFAEPASESDPNLPETVLQPFRGIAHECLHLDPKRRCSIAEIQARLEPAGRSVPAETEGSPRPRRPVKRGPIVAGLVVAALLVALVGFFSRGKSGSAPATSSTDPRAPEATSVPKPNPTLSEPATPRKKATVSQGGEVVRQVLPEVSQSARNTIRGTVKVGVRVDVDPSGKVTAARLKSAGPSRYFANAALKAAQRWEFSPQPAASAWLLQFRFRRGGVEALSERATR